MGDLPRQPLHVQPSPPLCPAVPPRLPLCSLDGKRLYVTTSLFSPWDKQFYPELLEKARCVLLSAHVAIETRLLFGGWEGRMACSPRGLACSRAEGKWQGKGDHLAGEKRLLYPFMAARQRLGGSWQRERARLRPHGKQPHCSCHHLPFRLAASHAAPLLPRTLLLQGAQLLLVDVTEDGLQLNQGGCSPPPPPAPPGVLLGVLLPGEQQAAVPGRSAVLGGGRHASTGGGGGGLLMKRGVSSHVLAFIDIELLATNRLVD